VQTLNIHLSKKNSFIFPCSFPAKKLWEFTEILNIKIAIYILLPSPKRKKRKKKDCYIHYTQRACMFLLLVSVSKHFFFNFFVPGNKKGTETRLVAFLFFFCFFIPRTKLKQKKETKKIYFLFHKRFWRNTSSSFLLFSLACRRPRSWPATGRRGPATPSRVGDLAGALPAPGEAELGLAQPPIAWWWLGKASG